MLITLVLGLPVKNEKWDPYAIAAASTAALVGLGALGYAIYRHNNPQNVKQVLSDASKAAHDLTPNNSPTVKEALSDSTAAARQLSQTTAAEGALTSTTSTTVRAVDEALPPVIVSDVSAIAKNQLPQSIVHSGAPSKGLNQLPGTNFKDFDLKSITASQALKNSPVAPIPASQERATAAQAFGATNRPTMYDALPSPFSRVNSGNLDEAAHLN